MCDVGRELDNAANSISNALGTDGSKNGLLNDPISLGVVAIGTGAWAAGAFDGIGAAAVADAGATSAATTISAAPAVAVDYGLNFSPTFGSVASSVAGGVSDAVAAVPWSAIGKGALEVGKAAVPVLLNGSGSRQPAGYGYSSGYPVRAGYQPDGSFVAVSPNGNAAAYGQPVNSYNAAPAAGGSMGLILLAAAALLVLNK